MKRLLLLSLALLALPFNLLFAQGDSTSNKGSFEYTFFVDAYYSYDFNQPYDRNRPDFLFNYNRHNQIGINNAVAKVNYTFKGLDANFGINTGDFPRKNMAAEPQLLQLLYEANVGYSFLNKWKVTAGMFHSHVGFENSIGFDNLLASHSLSSELTPYFLAGAKLEFMPNDKWLVGLTVANGNQVITETNNNKLLGLQLTWSPSEKFSLNYSNMYYNDQPDTAAQNLFYNNVYAIFEIAKKIDLIVGADVGLNDNTVNNQNDVIWLANVLARYRINEKFAIAGRFEHYNDEKNVIVSTPLGLGFVNTSYSINFDYSPVEFLKFRIEGRMFNTDQAIFRNDSDFNPNTSTTIRYSNQNSNILISMQAKF